MHFGEHFTIDGYDGSPNLLNDKALVLSSLNELSSLLKMTQLGPPVGKLGNQKIFECKLGTESNPDVPCQYQMNEPNGLVEVLLLPK